MTSVPAMTRVSANDWDVRVYNTRLPAKTRVPAMTRVSVMTRVLGMTRVLAMDIGYSPAFIVTLGYL